MSQTKKRWTASEDKYLRLSLKEGRSAAEVGRNLGRSAASVTQRKITLGCRGRFNRSTKTVIQTIKVLQAFDGQSPYTGSFDLETGHQVPSRFTKNTEARAKLFNTLQKMEVGQSFVLPSNLVYSARQIVNQSFGEYKIKIVSTDSSKKFSRLFRVM